ncbi:hypothetical protein Cni_G27128 [Canna indica]|uniref:Uncharacterized protein n=1 Tax=Canna indica TaxID=4628 RepID=A0AAQ3L0M8_9LILI|nr:hypothetical protein Cni_G27128 [Canna indica]
MQCLHPKACAQVTYVSDLLYLIIEDVPDLLYLTIEVTLQHPVFLCTLSLMAFGSAVLHVRIPTSHSVLGCGSPTLIGTDRNFSHQHSRWDLQAKIKELPYVGSATLIQLCYLMTYTFDLLL